MKRMLMIAAALASLAFAAAPSPSQAATSVGFSVRIGDPYRGAAIRFQSEPDYVVVPGTRIYYIEDYYGRDIYRYGGWFYMVDEDGFWYRARSLRGPFFAIDVDILPDVFYDVPSGYYHYWSPARLSGSYCWRSGDRMYYRGGTNYRTRDRYYGGGDRYYGGDRNYGGGDRYYGRDRNYSRDRGYQGGDRNYQGRTYRTRDNWDWNRAQENRTQDQNRVQQNNPPPQQDNRGDRGNRGNWRGRGRGQDNRDQGNNGNGNDNGNGRGNGRGRGHDNGND